MDDHAVLETGMGLVVGWGDPAVTGTASAGGFVLPTGTVAFLLTDVEASTRTWEAEPDAMAAAMGRHDAILDVAVSAHGGVRPLAQGEGDSIVAAFSRASDAVLAAVEAQRALTAECWPTSASLRVRMAVHAGEARTAADGNYAGQAIIRTARLRAITNGGQILVSEPARDLLIDHLGDKVTLLDLGEHRLRDLARPERVYQVTGSGLPDDFPPLNSLDAHRHNLPIQLSSFVGRVDDIATVADLVRGNRLVTIVGAGGSGKTRLALQAAAELVDQSTDGTWWVELENVRDPDLAVAAIASAIGVRGEIGAGAADALAHVLAEQQMLLVLDNCEHLVEVVALAVDKLLRGCPSIRVLATSRGPLEVSGEIAWRIPPMTCPAADGAPLAVSALSQFDSVRLFLDRAQHVRPGFTVDDSNAPAIAAISSRLDGVPLAIELAAARCRSMTPAQILDGLTDAFRLLTGSSRGVLPRQATLEASITWSHDLLSEPEKVLLRRLSVFAGGCTLDAAEAVCSDHDLVPRLSVLDLLDRLVAQSLVALDDQPDPPRYRLLETVRQYGAGRLDAAGETNPLRDRHLGHYLDTITAIRPTLEAQERGLNPAVFRPLFWERDNHLVALDHAADEGRWTDYATLATRADDILGEGNPDEAVAVLDRIPRDALDRALQAEVAYHLFGHLVSRGDPRCAVELDQALALSAGGVHPYLLALATQARLALIAVMDPVLAGPMLDQAAVARDAFGDPTIEILHAFAGLMLRGALQGDMTLARPYIHELERLRSVLPNSGYALNADIWTAVAAQHVGDLARASDCLDRAERWLAEHSNPALTSSPSLVAGVREGNRTNRGATSPDPSLSAYKLARRQALHSAADMLGLGAGIRLLASGDAATAFAMLDEVQDFAAAAGIRIMMAVPAAWAGRAALALGDVDEARARLTLADDIATANELTWPAGLAKAARAEIALADGDPEAPAVALAALEFAAAHTFRLEQIDVLEVLSVLASESHDHREVARLQGAVARARDDIGYGFRIPRITKEVDAAIDAAMEALGAEAFNAAFEDGQRLNLEEVTAYVLRSHGERKRPSSGWASLTPTERAVAEQVRLGLTNPQIAERLLMSRDTVKTHLSHIYTKLGVANRTELAVVSPSGDSDNG